ncbi:MAG: C45 family autoproteolytic acyltransferase/hydrolase [Micromonosporaceae bacterium]
MSIPLHISTESDASERGHRFGVAQTEAVRTTVASYRRLFSVAAGLSTDEVLELGTRVAEQLAPYPSLVTEIAGMARGAGVDERELYAVNARTEILGGARPECTVVGVLPQASADGELLLAQNWDWHPDQAAAMVLWRIRLADERWLVTLTEAGIVAKIGLNSSGLAVGLNLLRSDQDSGIGGSPIHVILRLLLERCDTLAHALELVRGAQVSASSCITIGAAGGSESPAAALVCAELTPTGTRLVWPDGTEPLAHTNHFLAPDAGASDRLVRLHPDTLTKASSGWFDT